MNTFQEYFNKRFLFEEAPGISAPGGLPGGPPGGGMGVPPGGMPPPGGGMGGGPSPGMGGGPGMGAPPGGGAPGGDMSGKKPLIVNSLDVWKTLKSIFGMDSEEEKNIDTPEKQTQLKHLQS